MTRHVQEAAVELVSTHPTSQGRDLVSGVFTPTRRPTRKSTLHPTGGAIESALSTQTYLHQTPCASRPRLNRCFSTQPRRGVNSTLESFFWLPRAKYKKHMLAPNGQVFQVRITNAVL